MTSEYDTEVDVPSYEEEDSELREIYEFAKGVGTPAALGGAAGSLLAGPAGASIFGGVLGGTSGFSIKAILEGERELDRDDAKELAKINGAAAGLGGVAEYLRDNHMEDAAELGNDVADQVASYGSEIAANAASYGPEGAALGVGAMASVIGGYVVADKLRGDDKDWEVNDGY